MAVTRTSTAAASRNTPTTPLSTSKTIQKGQNSRSITRKRKYDNATCSTSSVKRNMSPGIRLIGGRIYDSENGKTCHQCRQKTLDFSVSCRNFSGNKQCAFHYCHICLLNRYGEKAEEAAVLGCTWKCPSCRGVCNCSRCMKQRGCKPTGILLHTAKANGFSSVSEMLHLEEMKRPEKDEGASSKKRKATNEEPAASSKIGRRKSGLDGKENSICLHRSLKTEGNMKGSMTNKMAKTRKADGKDIFAKRKTKGDATLWKRIIGSTTTFKEADGKDHFARGKTKGDATLQKRIARSSANLREFPKGQEEVNVKADGNLKPNENISRQLSYFKDIDAKEPVNVRSFAAEKTVEDVQLSRKAAADVDVKVSNADIPLPQAAKLTKVANLDFDAEDIGHALQFLEFCEAFGQVLDLKKGQPEFLLQELTCCQNTHRRCDFSLERLHIKLLSMIQHDSENGCTSLKARGRKSWLEALVKQISGCPYISKEFILNCSHLSREGYEKLESSKKLKILTFLCDEALGTSQLRIWIDTKNFESVQERKKAKKMLLHQAKNAKMKLQDEVAKAILLRNGAPLSITEHQNLVSKIKVEICKPLQVVPQSSVVRSDPILSDADGRKFWKLKSHSGEMDVLLQDVSCRDQITTEENWFFYDVHQKADIEKYISSVKEA
ncbi:hypothetical protein ACH5RR_008645 [Cinchona calisaya]|uniref:DDT domain-containing protein n=1 Tax=Cinchona calisaya TaxID=153742 RepID=A0ABD3AHJ1_9GENT